jgi:hypothetical protein
LYRYGPIKAEYDISRRTITRTNYEVGVHAAQHAGKQPMPPAARAGQQASGQLLARHAGCAPAASLTYCRRPLQVDFLTAYNKLAGLGCKLVPDAYLHAVTADVKRL